MATNTSPGMDQKEFVKLLKQAVKSDPELLKKLVPEIGDIKKIKKSQKEETITAKKIAQEVKKPGSTFNKMMDRALRIPVIKAFAEGAVRMKTAFGQYFSKLSNISSGIFRTAFGKILDELSPVIESFKATIDLFKTGFLYPMMRLFLGGPLKLFIGSLGSVWENIKKLFEKDPKELEVAKKQLSVQDEMVKKLKRLKRIFKKIEYNTKNATMMSKNADAKYWGHRSRVEAKLSRLKEKAEKEKTSTPPPKKSKVAAVKGVLGGIGSFLTSGWVKPIVGIFGVGLIGLLFIGLWKKFLQTEIGQWVDKNIWTPFKSWAKDTLLPGFLSVLDIIKDAIAEGIHNTFTSNKESRKEFRERRISIAQGKIDKAKAELKVKGISPEKVESLNKQIAKQESEIAKQETEGNAYKRIKKIKETAGFIIPELKEIKDIEKKLDTGGYDAHKDKIEAFIQTLEKKYNISYAQGGRFRNGKFTVPGTPSKKDNTLLSTKGEIGYILSLQGKENAKRMGIRGFAGGGPPNPDINSSSPGSIGELLQRAAKQTGSNDDMLEIMKKLVHVESGGNPDAKNPNGSAGGLFQFIDTTWASMLTKYGGRHGLGAGTSKYNAWANALMGAEFTKQNFNEISSSVLSQPPNAADLYMAHFLGHAGATKFFKGLKDNGNSPAYNWVSAKAANDNSSIFFVGGNRAKPRTLQQVYALMAEKMSVDPSKTLAKSAGGTGGPSTSSMGFFESLFSSLNPFGGGLSNLFSSLNPFGGVANAGETNPLSSGEAGGQTPTSKAGALASAERDKQEQENVRKTFPYLAKSMNEQTQPQMVSQFTTFVLPGVDPMPQGGSGELLKLAFENNSGR